MSYNTRYSFEAPDSFVNKLEELKSKHIGQEQHMTQRVVLDKRGHLRLDGYGFFPDGGSHEFGGGDVMKFYEYDSVFKELSKEFSGLWTVEGEGEESGDIWKHYFQDGKSFKTKAKLTFEPFDKNKLK